MTREQLLTSAAAAPVELTVRELLGNWGYRARNYESVATIRHDLSAAGLRCEPDFADDISSSAVVTVRTATAATAGESSSSTDASSSSGAGDYDFDEPLQLPPVALLVRDIPSANCDLMSVRPDDTLERAQALMSAHLYSQLPVMSGPRDLDGAVSWQSIARARLTHAQLTLADAMIQRPMVVHANDPLLEQTETIFRHDFVFVQGEDHRITGIVTAADLTARFRDLTTPFFQLGECEGRLRRCIGRTFTVDQIRTATGNKKLQSADGMTFGEYMRLLDDDGRWKSLNWGVERETFVEYLNKARIVRNKVMHFGEALTALDKEHLLHLYNCMRDLDWPH